MTNAICISTFLNAPLAVVLSVTALITLLTAQHMKNKSIAVAMRAASFLCVIACITYALLLGAELKEALIYILFFAFVSLIGSESERKEPCGNEENVFKEATENESDGKAAIADPAAEKATEEAETGGEHQ